MRVLCTNWRRRRIWFQPFESIEVPVPSGLVTHFTSSQILLSLITPDYSWFFDYGVDTSRSVNNFTSYSRHTFTPHTHTKTHKHTRSLSLVRALVLVLTCSFVELIFKKFVVANSFMTYPFVMGTYTFTVRYSMVEHRDRIRLLSLVWSVWCITYLVDKNI